MGRAGRALVPRFVTLRRTERCHDLDISTAKAKAFDPFEPKSVKASTKVPLLAGPSPWRTHAHVGASMPSRKRPAAFGCAAIR